MGYPTDANATARARAATGQSNPIRWSPPAPQALPRPAPRGAPSGWASGWTAENAQLLDNTIPVEDTARFAWSRAAEARNLALFAVFAAEYAKNLADIWISLGDDVLVNLPGTATQYCSGKGDFQGVIEGGACAELQNAGGYPPVTTFGWQRPLGRPYYTWVNHAVVEVYGPGENPWQPGWGFPSYAGEVAGMWTNPSSEGRPDPLEWIEGVPDFSRAARPQVNPHADPNSEPVRPDEAFPAPRRRIRWREIPDRKRNPHRSPDESDSRGNELPAYPAAPRPQPKPQWPVVRHRPGKNTKDKKGNTAQGRIISWAMEVTEGVDLLKALWQALPKSAHQSHTKGTSKTTEMLQDVYRHWNEVDIEVAVENIIINQIEDALIGMVEGLVDKAKIRANVGKEGGFKNIWQQKALTPNFEGDLAQFISGQVEDYIRALVPSI